MAVFIAGLNLRTGFGRFFDLALAAAAGVLIVAVTALLIALLLTIARRVPRKTTSLILGCGVVLMLVWWEELRLGVAMAVVIGLAEGFLGANIATFASGEFGRAAMARKIITGVLFAVSIAANVALVWLLVHEGSNAQLVTWRPPAQWMPAQLAVPDPSLPGPYRFKTLTYGSGTDLRRPEYRSVAIKTPTVNASRFFDDFGGWKRRVRRQYWGFDLDKLPLNGRVWYPEGDGPCPLVLIVHGNHEMSEFSDPGYAYLGELLASRGFILASIDENFLNSGLFHDLPAQQPVRGWVLLEHLKRWREWNSSPGNPFYGRVDMQHVALIGHSRGGEAAATAAAFNRLKYYPEDSAIHFDYNFAIQAIVAIAPAGDQYKPAGEFRWIQDVSYLTLQGAHDADVSSFYGSRQWEHVRFTQAGPWFKAEIYAYRANHGQFNTVWGRNDSTGPPLGWLLNLKPLLPPDEQRRIAKTYISAFLETTLKGAAEYRPLFQDWRTGRAWLPDTIYVNRYRDPSYIPLASFDEDADLTTTTASGGTIAGEHLSKWHEGRIPFRQGDRGFNGVFLGWNRKPGTPAPTYTLTLPEGAAGRWKLNGSSTLQLSVAALDEDASDDGPEHRDSPDFTVELETAEGAIARAQVSHFAAIPPPLITQFTKLEAIDSITHKVTSEPVFQTVRIPLDKLANPGKLAKVRLQFDVTRVSVICLSSIGFGWAR